MGRVAIVGYGAMAQYAAQHVRQASHVISHCIIRPGREDVARAAMGPDVTLIEDIGAATEPPDLCIECAGHTGLIQHGAAILRAQVPLITASLGALADDDLHTELRKAATDGNTQLRLISGAIGALDALSAARVGGLSEVTYTGRKPPGGWRGTPAEDVADLETLSSAITHFDGTAREAALRYPKNANVAAAVALAGVGFVDSRVTLIADPAATGNLHKITAQGSFGAFTFEITGNSLPDTPRTSALAAMSMVDQVLRHAAPVSL